ncbi:MAG: TolC family protein [Rikenellaceae bacterium]|jgi:outer membrane protein TolC|nr:TolC family protein [Rikenellaceae bacterium]
MPNRYSFRPIACALLLLGGVWNLSAQQQTQLQFTLEEVIAKAQEQSAAAYMAKHNFLSSYWQYRSYKAQLLPSLNLSGTLGSYNRSLLDLQDPTTGEIRYIENNNMRNNLNLSINQNIPLTGGTLSVYSSLSRIDEFSPERNILYNSQPLNITYLQPLRGYNSLKWEQKISPEEYEQAKRVFLESMEDITIQATQYYFDMLLAQSRLEMAEKNYENTKTMYAIAEERFNIGSVTKSDLLQLELRLYNDGIAVNQNRIELQRNMLSLRSFLGYNELVDISLVPLAEIPSLTLNYNEVLDYTYANSSFSVEQDLQLLRAEQSVAQAKGNRGIDLTLRAQFGLTQQGGYLSSAYRNPIDQEIISLGVSLPIIDWGQGRGRVKMAQSQEELIKIRVEQAHVQHRQNIMMSVLEFNNQKDQCALAAKADSIARERYEFSLDRFANNAIGVLDLNTAQSEKDQAAVGYISELRTYWVSYYTIRKNSLYDYISRTDISAEFDRITEE